MKHAFAHSLPIPLGMDVSSSSIRTKRYRQKTSRLARRTAHPGALPVPCKLLFHSGTCSPNYIHLGRTWKSRNQQASTSGPAVEDWYVFGHREGGCLPVLCPGAAVFYFEGRSVPILE